MRVLTMVAALAAGLMLGAGQGMAKDAMAPPGPEVARHSFEQAKALVDAGIAHLKAVGPDKAFADFNDPKGKWVKDDLYLFAFDAKGIYRATGFRPERTGQNAWEMTDSAGLKVVQEILKRAKRDGTGTVDYLWKNPATNKLENKTSYVAQAGDYVLGAGFYHK